MSFTRLGAIEPLLSAVFAVGMSGHRHRLNAKVLAQGVANVGAAFFGGFCVTGTIARTAANVSAGSWGPVSGTLHTVFVPVFILIAAPLAGYVFRPVLGKERRTWPKRPRCPWRCRNGPPTHANR